MLARLYIKVQSWQQLCNSILYCLGFWFVLDSCLPLKIRFILIISIFLKIQIQHTVINQIRIHVSTFLLFDLFNLPENDTAMWWWKRVSRHLLNVQICVAYICCKGIILSIMTSTCCTINLCVSTLHNYR